MARLAKRVSLALSARAGEDGDHRAETLPFSPAPVALVWEVQPHDGRLSFDCDLTEFVVGSPKRNVTPRPRLIRELAPAIGIDSVGKPKSSVVLTLVYLRQFWRFLDHLAAAGAGDVAGCQQVTHAHGQLFKTWLLQDSGWSSSSAKAPLGAVRHLVSDARRRTGVEGWRLLWPTIEQKARYRTQGRRSDGPQAALFRAQGAPRRIGPRHSPRVGTPSPRRRSAPCWERQRRRDLVGRGQRRGFGSAVT